MLALLRRIWSAITTRDQYDQCIECTKCIGHEPDCSLG